MLTEEAVLDARPPSPASSYSNIGLVYAKVGDFDQAIRVFTLLGLTQNAPKPALSAPFDQQVVGESTQQRFLVAVYLSFCVSPTNIC